MRGKVIIAAAVVVALGLGGGGYWYFWMRPGEIAAAKAAPKKKLFAAIKPMVVGLSPSGKYGLASGTVYLQVGFQFETVHKKAIKDFASIKPAIRGHVMDLMLNLPLTVIHKKKIRTQMKQSVLDEVNKVIAANDPKAGKHSFDHIYITHFITQQG